MKMLVVVSSAGNDISMEKHIWKSLKKQIYLLLHFD